MKFKAARPVVRHHSRNKRSGQRVDVSATAAAVLALGAVSAHAYGIAASPYLTGDWGGLRTRLAEQDVNSNLGYGGEVAHNSSGGTEHLTCYTDQWVVSTALDLQKLAGWQGATSQAAVTNHNGRNLDNGANIDSSTLIQEVYGRGQTWHLMQLWLNRKLLDNWLGVKAGHVMVGEDFFSLSRDFQDLTFCGSQPDNLVGDHQVNWPTSQWGARAKVYTLARTYAQIGVCQINPNYVDDGWVRCNGWELNNPGGITGVLIPLGFGWTSTIGGRPSTYRVGVWYSTSNGKDLHEDVDGNVRGIIGLDAKQRSGQYGVCLGLQQQIAGAPGGRGVMVLLNFPQAGRDTAQTDHQISMGVQYKGPFDRLADTVDLVVGATHNNGRYADFVRQTNARTGVSTAIGDGYEYVNGLHYSWLPVKSVYFRPNLQYILYPSGTPQNKSAFVVGLKTGVMF